MVTALSPRAFIVSPKITATTTTAKILLFEPSTSTTFDGTALITVVNGLYASSVATLEVVVAGRFTENHPMDLIKYANNPANVAPHT